MDKEIESTKTEIELIDEVDRNLKDDKNNNEDDISDIDGGASVNTEKEAELEKSISTIQEKLSKDKTVATTEITKNTADITKAEVEIIEIDTTIEDTKKDLENAKVDLAKHKV